MCFGLIALYYFTLSCGFRCTITSINLVGRAQNLSASLVVDLVRVVAR